MPAARALPRQWLFRFHDWSCQPANSGLRDIFAKNKVMQGLKWLVNYDWLMKAVDRYPDQLQNQRDLFEEIADMAKDELKDEEALSVIHGDFWTGK